MKVLLTHRPGGAYGYISDGWLNALVDSGHEARRWDGCWQSWDDFGPDLYIGCSGHKQDLPPDRGRCKLAIHVNPYGPVDLGPINEQAGTIDWVRRARPDAVFGYGKERDRHFWSYWQERHGISWVPMPTGGDITVYRHGGDVRRNRDVVYVGGRWPYKTQTIDKFLMPLLYDTRVTRAVHGWGTWPPSLCSGRIDDEQVPALYWRGKVAPCISEPHTQQWGIDVPERYFKAVLCGCLAVHDPVPGLSQLVLEAIVASNPGEFRDLCVQYSRPESFDANRELAAAQYREVCGGHTYHHRMATLLRALGFVSEADRCLDRAGQDIERDI